MGELGRGFVAVELPPAVLDAVEAVAGTLDLASTARRTARPQWHLTLQFLGNRVDFEAVGEALGALAVAPGVVQLGGAGAFPTLRRARVLWIGVIEGAEYLAQLAAAVGVLLAPLGHQPEARPYHGHLTLARCKTATDLRPLVAGLGAGPVGQAFTVRDVVVFQSHVRRGGAEYEARARIALPASG